MRKTRVMSKPALSVFVAATLLFGMLGCGLFAPRTGTPTPTPAKVDNNNSPLVLKAAFTAEMMPFAQEMASRFNAGRASGQVKVSVVAMDSTEMVDAISQPDPAVQAAAPAAVAEPEPAPAGLGRARHPPHVLAAGEQPRPR